jgi:hypothetical protein
MESKMRTNQSCYLVAGKRVLPPRLSTISRFKKGFSNKRVFRNEVAMAVALIQIPGSISFERKGFPLLLLPFLGSADHRCKGPHCLEFAASSITLNPPSCSRSVAGSHWV